MSRWLGRVNLAGVLLVAGLCGFQWHANRQLNLDLRRIEKARQELAARTAEQEKLLKGYTADLDAFREQLSRAAGSLNETGGRLKEAERRLGSLAAERDQLQAGLSNWVAAVAARDAQLTRSNEELKKLAADRNEAVVRFNELAEKYNSLVKELDQARPTQAGVPIPARER